jgi:sRNA-binding regulator protein Hfq
MNKTEAKLQQELVVWFRNNFCLKHQSPRCAIFSIPNEAQGKSEMMYKKAIGLLPGASDLQVLLPNRCIFVEVKTEIGKQSEKQKDFEKTVTDLGFEYYLVRSLDDFKRILAL